MPGCAIGIFNGSLAHCAAPLACCILAARGAVQLHSGHYASLCCTSQDTVFLSIPHFCCCAGAEFSLAQVPTDPVFAQMYDRSTEFWNLLFNIQRQISSKKRTFASQFWGTQMRFYKQMLMALKVSSLLGMPVQLCP